MIILLLTKSFPYEGGEQFLESEMDVWSRSGNKVLILPHKVDGKVRGKWEGCKLIRIPKITRSLGFLYGLFRVFLSKILYVELTFLINNGKFSVDSIYRAIRSGAGIYKQFYLQRSVLRRYSDIAVIYSYWNTVESYASTILGHDIKCVTRMHGFDLFEYRAKNGHHFYKRQFLHKFDLVCVLSESAQEYVSNVYKYSRSECFPLGVSIPMDIPVKPNDEIVRVLSLSYIVPVKRVHKIIEGISDYLSTHPNTKVEWTHIGGGPLQESIMEYYSLKAKGLPFEARFLGQMTNKDVQKHLACNYYDVLVNTSESEGVPVSMMEAMSYGIPVIATNVGGVSSLVKRSCGYLVSSEARPEEITKGLCEIVNEENLLSYRNNSRSRILNNYNKNKNYDRFIEALQSLGVEG